MAAFWEKALVPHDLEVNQAYLIDFLWNCQEFIRSTLYIGSCSGLQHRYVALAVIISKDLSVKDATLVIHSTCPNNNVAAAVAPDLCGQYIFRSVVGRLLRAGAVVHACDREGNLPEDIARLADNKCRR